MRDSADVERTVRVGPLFAGGYGAVLTGFWYLVTGAEAVAPGRTVPATLIGEALLVGRTRAGAVFAYADRCPHRGMAMRHGTFDGATLRCGYHGWAFAAEDGRCVAIPALAEPDPALAARFRLRSLPCREVQGNIWVYVGDGRADALPDIPTMPGLDGQVPRSRAVMRFPCAIDTAVFGFIDPGHPAFVHTSRWWKRKPGALRLKEKEFEPEGMGFRMKTHVLRGGANPYRLLGRDPRVSVGIQLPGVRIEHIAGSRHMAGVLAAATPIDARTTDVHYCIYWTIPWLGPLRPLARLMTRDFLRQDRDVAAQLAEAGAPDDPTLFVGDVDTQIRWWLRLKKELAASRAEARAFVNPLPARTLRWRS